MTWLTPVREATGPAARAGRRAQRDHGLRRRETGGSTCTYDHPPHHQAAPADAVRDTYLTRWSASEHHVRGGQGHDHRGGIYLRPVLRSGSPRLVIQEAWAWLTATQLVRASEAAALRSEAAAARALRRRDAVPVTADEESFTAARLHMLRSMESTQVTATSSLNAITAAADSAARAALHVLNVPGRQRHSRRAQKARPKFPHATGTKTTVTGKPQVTVFAPGFY